MKEADQIDSVTASHEAFLEFSDLGVSDIFFIYIYMYIYMYITFILYIDNLNA